MFRVRPLSQPQMSGTRTTPQAAEAAIMAEMPKPTAAILIMTTQQVAEVM
jgi:hypothetical protein